MSIRPGVENCALCLTRKSTCLVVWPPPPDTKATQGVPCCDECLVFYRGRFPGLVSTPLSRERRAEKKRAGPSGRGRRKKKRAYQLDRRGAVTNEAKMVARETGLALHEVAGLLAAGRTADEILEGCGKKRRV